MKWNIDLVLERAKRCISYSQFQSNYYAAYCWAKENGLICEIEKVLPPITHEERARRGAITKAYTDQELIDDAKHFSTREQWKNSGVTERKSGKHSHYGAAIKRGRDFMRQCCNHMPDLRGKQVHITYSEEEITASALKFKHRGEWKQAEPRYYQAAHRRKIIDKVSKHMAPAANPYAGDYIIYAFEFSDHHVYVGLTFRDERYYEHISSGPVARHMKICSDYVFKIVQENIQNPSDAITSEGKWQDTYKTEGWLPLWKAKHGSLGTLVQIKWTHDAILAEARKYQTKQAWINGSQRSYRLAKREGWFEEASAHMPKRVLGVGKGLKRSKAARHKMAAAKHGTKQSPEHRAARAAAIKKWWANKKSYSALVTSSSKPTANHCPAGKAATIS